MHTIKKIGIWMDHANAHVMEYTTDPIETKTLYNRDHGGQDDYYKALADVIQDHDSLLLFGPTDAKAELFNILRTHHQFEKMKIEVVQADKMTENQQHAFVKEHFSKH